MEKGELMRFYQCGVMFLLWFSPSPLLSMGPLSQLIRIKTFSFVKNLGEILPNLPFLPNPPLLMNPLSQLICIKTFNFVENLRDISSVSPFSPNGLTKFSPMCHVRNFLHFWTYLQDIAEILDLSI